MKRFPLHFVADGNRRRAGVDVQQFVRNRFPAQGLEVRAVRPDRVQPVLREEHDLVVHSAPRLRADDADLLGNPL